MNPITSSQWTGSKGNTIIAQINIGDEEIKALGGILERSDSDLGKQVSAVFSLNSGKIIALIKTEGNRVPGYTLILAGPGHPEVLGQFLQEAGLARDRVTIELRP
jgi:hypothetical protein